MRTLPEIADMLHTIADELFADYKHTARADSLRILATQLTKMPDPLEAMREVEAEHFRTVTDTGSHPAAMCVWNGLRRHMGLPHISKDDLPAWSGQKYETPKASRLLTNS